MKNEIIKFPSYVARPFGDRDPNATLHEGEERSPPLLEEVPQTIFLDKRIN